MDPVSFLFWRFYYFFRDPLRRIPSGRVVVSPADGYVVYVSEVEKGRAPCPFKEGVGLDLEELGQGGERFEDGGTQIGIYMAPTSVHFNRAPIGGTVAHIVGRPAKGENRSMAKTLARLIWKMPPYVKESRYVADNARNSIVIAGEFPVLVVQIADRYVRAIDCFIQEGERVEAGQKIGMIRMGSQCDLFIPRRSAAAVLCRPGDKVLAGETILARY
ncbi:MAG: phosphatidylserine decarboxylase [Pseudomonadota bacterium]